jgi:hypothetical protein
MLTVLLISCISSSCLQVWRWHLRARYISAQRDHLAFSKYYEEGRVTALKYFEKSEALMAAELALSDEDKRSAIVSRHIARAVRVMEQEEEDLKLSCRRGIADFVEAREYVDELITKTRMQP